MSEWVPGIVSNPGFRDQTRSLAKCQHLTWLYIVKEGTQSLMT